MTLKEAEKLVDCLIDVLTYGQPFNEDIEKARKELIDSLTTPKPLKGQCTVAQFDHECRPGTCAMQNASDGEHDCGRETAADVPHDLWVSAINAYDTNRQTGHCDAVKAVILHVREKDAATIEALRAERDAIVSLIPTQFLDPPDGGEAKPAKLVRRLVAGVAALEGALRDADTAYKEGNDMQAERIVRGAARNLAAGGGNG